MAGPKKGKNKKKKEKSNPQKSNSKLEDGQKQAQKSNSKLDVEQTQGHGCVDELSEESSGKINVLDDEQQLTDKIYKKIEWAYKEACDMLMAFNYSASTAQTAMLGGGYMIGDGNIVSNIVMNSICYIDSCPVVDGKYVLDEVPIFENMYELIMFWVQTLVSFAAKVYPQGTPRCQLLHRILSCKSIDVMGICRDYKLAPEGEGSDTSDNISISSNATEFDILLKVNLDSFETARLTRKTEGDDNNAAGSSNSGKVLNPKEAVPRNINNITRMETNPLSKDSGSGQNLNPLESRPEGLIEEETNLQEWLRNSSDDGKDEMVRNLESLVKSLERQVQERKEWAERKEREVNEKEKQYSLELNTLRQEKLGVEEMKNEKKEFATVQITKMLKTDIESKRLGDELAYLDRRIEKIEAEVSQLRADVAACKVDDAEMKMKLKQAIKKEKEELRKIEGSDKQTSKFQEQIHEEKGKILQLSQQLHTVDEAQNEIKLRLKQEQEEREKANDLRLEERKLLRIEKENAKQRLASLQQALEMEEKLLLDEKFRLMEELTILKLPHLLSNEEPSSSSGEHVSGEAGSSQQDNNGGDDDDDDIPDHRRCIMCFRKEVCVLFIPCAHLVVCYSCGERIGAYCPCCQVQIAQKVRVYGAG